MIWLIWVGGGWKRPGREPPDCRASKRGHGEHKSKGFARALSGTNGAGRRGWDSAHLCESGLRVGLFIISRQHTQAWKTAPPSHRALPAGKKQGARRCRRNANERAPPPPPPRSSPTEIAFSPAPAWGSDGSVNSSRRLFSDTKPHVPTINQRLQAH